MCVCVCLDLKVEGWEQQLRTQLLLELRLFYILSVIISVTTMTAEDITYFTIL